MCVVNLIVWWQMGKSCHWETAAPCSILLLGCYQHLSKLHSQTHPLIRGLLFLSRRWWEQVCWFCAFLLSSTAETSELLKASSRWPSAWSSWPSACPWGWTVATPWTQPETWDPDCSQLWQDGGWRSSGRWSRITYRWLYDDDGWAVWPLGEKV